MLGIVGSVSLIIISIILFVFNMISISALNDINDNTNPDSALTDAELEKRNNLRKLYNKLNTSHILIYSIFLILMIAMFIYCIYNQTYLTSLDYINFGYLINLLVSILFINIGLFIHAGRFNTSYSKGKQIGTGFWGTGLGFFIFLAARVYLS